MGCVNKSSREFKDLAAKHNLASNQLELYTHKYWLETGNETLFPTDVYIQAQIGNVQYQEDGKSVRKLWQRDYSSTKEFHDIKALNAAKKEASRYFPKSAITSYRNTKENLVLSVKRPVEKVNYDKDDFFKEMDSLGSMKDVKVLNLGIKDNQTYGIGKVQELYNRFNTDRTSKDLADRVFTIARDLGLDVSFGENLTFGNVGRYTNNNTITYKKSFLERDIMNSIKAPILLHEVIHALSMYALSNQTTNWKKPEALQEFRAEMNSLYQDLKSNPILKGERGIVDVYEFVAELGNPIFRNKIKEIDKQNKAKKSFWSRVLDAFKSLFDLHSSNSYYKRSMNALDKALDAFDLDTYMRYNGVKNLLRQGYNEKEWEFNSLSEEQLKSKVDDYFDKNTINKEDNRSENKNNIQYEQSIKSAGELFKEAYKLLETTNNRQNEESQSLRSSLAKTAAEQRKLIINLAEKTGNLVAEPNDYYDEVYGEGIAESTEAKVWKDEKANNAIKAIFPNHYASLSKLLDRIAIHNMAFPNTAMVVEKIGASDEGISIIVKQPWIEDSDEIPTYTEIKKYMKEQGFNLTKGKGPNAEYFKDNYIVSDIRPENVIKQPDGTLAVIDCFAVFKGEASQRTSQSALQDFISSLSGKDLKDELSLIKQESADYDLVNHIEEEKKHSGKAVPQDFTFADGTKVKAPFKPNAQQIDALNAMDAFIKSNETSMTLSGYAGTGKTSLMEIIAKKSRKQGRPVMFCATTNKAAAVLNDRVSRAGFKAETLNKTFGISVEVDSTKTYNARNLVNALKEKDIMPGTTIIIDEASMINEENYRILNEIASQKGLKIIYVGDEAQLAPVNEDKISKVFRNGDGKVIRLTQVERTDDNAILKEATAIRNGQPLSGETSFNSKGEGVAYISSQHQDAINEVVEHYIKGLKKDPNYFRILAYTNKAVTSYNNQVRELLGYTSPIPNVGEPMTGYANWGYDWRTKSYRFINSESYKVLKVDKPTKVQTRLENGTPITMEAISITLQDPMGNTDTFNFMDIKGNPTNRQNAMLLAEEKKRLWAKAKQVFGRNAKAEVYAKINAIDGFLFVNDNLEDNNHNLLQAKTIDFGYAMTVHKSQGSTFTNVLMDDVDISKAGLSSNITMETVDIEGNTPINYDNIEITNEESIDLGDLDDVEVEGTTNTNQVANVKQQLEYVGVSRATDTVTIISNNVKKEGSPLHPEKNIKEDIIKDNNQRSNSSITQQVVDHLKSIPGINVLNRAAMKEFLKTHNPKYLQQYISKSSLPNGELSVLSSALMTKYGNNTSYGDIIQTANYEYTVNYKGAGEFDIIEYHQIDNNLNSKYNDREREGFPESPDRWSTRNEITKGEYNSDSYHVENREANGNNVGLDIQTSQRESNQASSNDGSSQHQEWSEIKRDSATGRIAFVNGDGRTISTSEDWKNIETFTTPQGEVYGFVDKDGNIYLDETKISPEHPIHEYTHLWDRAVQKRNPQLWQRGIELMKKTSLWNDILNDEHYGKVWQSMNLSNEKLDSLIASEAHSRLVGENGEKLLNNLAKNKGEEGIISKLKQWILDMWKEVKTTFGSWSKEDLDALTLKDFNHMTVRDFIDGTDLTKQQANTDQTNIENNKGTEPTVETPSLPEGTTQKVSLPSYEYFNDLYEETPVDAAWKIPYLKELDAQLSGEKSPEENKNILNQMDTVLQATSEKEYKQELADSKVNKVDVKLNEYDKLNKQIDTLLEGKEYEDAMVKPISATELRHIAELIGNEISDFITDLQKEEGLAKKWFPTLNTKRNFQTATRQQIVQTVGINRLIDRAKKLFDTEYQDYDDIDMMIQSTIITDNWDAVMVLAADTFAFNEGFGIKKDYREGNWNTTERARVDFDNFNDYSNDPDVAAEEGEKDEQEKWQIEMRTIDVLNSMSALVRQGLHECYLLNDDGTRKMSKWNIPERVNPRKATNSILRWTQGSLSLDDMIKRLSDKQKQNPWLSQIITRLSDKSGKETDFQSQFYGVFQKHFQQYSIVLNEDGKYYSMIVNSHPALTDVMKGITSKYSIGEHPMFGDNGKINAKLLNSIDKSLETLQHIDKNLKLGNTLDEDISKSATDNILNVCKVMGLDLTESDLTDIINAENISDFTKYLGFLSKYLNAALEEQKKGTLKNYDPFKFGQEYGIRKTLSNLLTPITDKMEDTAVSAFYDSGKMYQSYVTPSFMTKMFSKFKQGGKATEDFILENYGTSEFFRFNPDEDVLAVGWRNRWLQMLANDEKSRQIFDHKVELNFNKHNYMRNMSDAEYTLSLITEYFSNSTDMIDAPAWYRVPMQSNKPSSEFIQFYSYRDSHDGYKDNIVDGLKDVFLQELSRIQTVRMRNMDKKDSGFIKNFDTNGRKFCFLPVFNAYLSNETIDIAKRTILKNEEGTIPSDNARFASLLQKKLNGEEALTSDEETVFGNLAEKIIKQSTEDRIQSILNSWEKNGILEAAKSIKNIYPTRLNDDEASQYVRKQVENFLWNDAYASKMILQLTLTDIAFYKDTEDLQKRLAQLHAPGVRGNIYATDYEGNQVSDGKYRTFILQDFDSFKSNIIANISEVFDRRIANAPDNQKAAMKALKESLVGKDGKYTKINVTDAQGYSSPSSYRKKALIFGRWSKEAEDIYQKLLKGEYTYTDLETAFQPLKPFVYSKLTKDMGIDNAPIHSMQVPFQAKNAEYLLIMADAILKGESLSRPNLLRAVYRVMEDSEKLMPTKGIDTVQFESSIKSGLQGKMNIFQFRDMAGGEEAAYTFMKNQIFKEEYDQNTGERIYRNYNTDTFIHEASYEDYCLQQEVPEHFKEHSQAHGSQIRMITPSDLDLYTIDEDGNQVDNYYEWTEPDGIKKRMKADEFRKEYEQTIAENIEESINDLTKELHLDSDSKKERNIALSEILQREILSSPRYGIDLMQACSIDKETGEFRIPKGDPIQAKRIEQLINSLIKNRVNKQKIAGGPIVQVSNFGTSTQLHIRFNDREGNLMPLEEEYNPDNYVEHLPYKEYIKKYQGGIAYFEVYAPIWDNDLFYKFANPDGTINVDAINNVNPELLKMVSYRIPTEDKYSCAPMKVVGFMPREAGDAIMFPYELTEIDDSDFDVDKRYVMRKDIDIREKNPDDYIDELEDRGKKLYKKFFKEEPASGYVERTIDELLRNPQKFNTDSPFRKALYAERQNLAYYTDTPIAGRRYRDNKIIDMTYAVLTNQMTADKILNPGGFDAPKKMGYMVAAYKNPANNVSWDALQGMSIDDLKKLSYTDKDLTFADTQVQFYKQNSAAASLIGVFAVNKVAHATLEGNDIWLDVSEICGDDNFTIANTTFGDRMQIDQKFDSEGNLIGKTLGSLVSASADAVKDPILNLMNVNMTTAGMLNTMLRLGMTFDDAALFLSQDVIERLLNQFNRENLTGYAPLSGIIENWITEYKKKYNIADSSAINAEALTKEELVEGLTANAHEAIDYKVLLAFQKMRALTDAMRNPTFITRFNSISSAVGPLIVDNLITEHKVEKFMDANNNDGTHFYKSDGTPVDAQTILEEHPVLEQFNRTVDIAKSMFLDMPTGNTGFRNLMKELPKDVANKMYADKKLLDSFSNFYQSYLLVQSGLVNPKNLKAFVTGFPKWFVEQNFKKEYPDNALIQAIRLNVAKGTRKPYLQINITGMDEQAKEELRSAWIDLHKVDPKLSKMLFDYSFFRAGVGFSPKTFMSLVPTYVKERLKDKNTGASYIDTYRKFPTVANDLVIDQFIRNNWTNNKLVPIKGGKDSHYNIDVKHGLLTVYREEEIADLAGLSYIKTKSGKQTYLWHLKEQQNGTDLAFELVKPLGNNGEYLEMSTENITTPLSETINTTEENASEVQENASDLKTESTQETEISEPINSTISKTEQIKNLSSFADLIMEQNEYVGKPIDKEEALKRAENMKKNPDLYSKFFQTVFERKGLHLNREEAINEFKKYC